MSKLRLSLVSTLALAAAPLLAQPAPTAAPVKVQSGSVPKNAKPAEIQDVHRMAAPEDPFEQERLGLASVNGGALGRARTFFDRAWAIGDFPTAAYNLACVDLREGKREEAFKDLKRAIDAGFDDEQTLVSDPDLQSVRQLPEFKAFVEGARKNKEAGDKAAVSEALYAPPTGAVQGVLCIVHDRASDPLHAAGPFVDEAKARGLFVVAPRGPVRLGKRGFDWQKAGRAFAAIDGAVVEAKKRGGRSDLPVILIGIGRGGSMALGKAAASPGLSGVASVGGPWDRGLAGQSGMLGQGLKGPRVFLGIPAEAPANLLAVFHKSVEDLRSLGVTPQTFEWKGGGTAFPSDVRVAAKQVLDAVAPAQRAN